MKFEIVHFWDERRKTWVSQVWSDKSLYKTCYGKTEEKVINLGSQTRLALERLHGGS